MFHNYVTAKPHNLNDLEVAMNIEARRAYIKAVKERYTQSSKKDKSRILNELCLICGYSRKHAIKLLSENHSLANVLEFKRRPGAPKTYSSSVDARLVELWQIMNYPCSRHLKQALPLWLPYDLDTDEDTKRQLLAMSESTIERRLRPTKNKRPKGKSATTPPKLKTQIPLKLCKEDDRKTVGFFEADTVAHCGDSLSGEFAWTLTMTDLCSGWTENRVSLTKSAEQIKAGVKDIEKSLPFVMMGFSSDNGSEFLNSTLHEFLVEERGSAVEFTRGRPYKKNDNAHVEQKNFTHVRNIFGYERIEGRELVEKMNYIYRELWCPLKNFYTPCIKLKEKQRVGSKIKKRYDIPKTPFQRLLDSKQLSMKEVETLQNRKNRLNPFKLQRRLKLELKEFYEMLEKHRYVRRAA